jgi:hypothetical protein
MDSVVDEYYISLCGGVVWVRSSPSQVDGLMKYVAVVVVVVVPGGVGAVRCARRPLFGGAIAF